MKLVNDAKKAVRLVKNAARSRAIHQTTMKVLRAHGPHENNRFRIAVYFADDDVNMYQLRQWYGPLAELSKIHPVVVLSRKITGAGAIVKDGVLPVAFVRKVTQLEKYLDSQDIRIVLYVNQNTRNFQMFRYGERWHVFINHGESDKMYMTTNQFKAYDYALIAGDAARERLSRTLWDYDLDRRTISIGRPQADHYSGDLPYTPDGRTVVLYTPTWEGDRPAAAYGSIATHGEALAKALLADPKYRLIYRPHPRSGVIDHAYGAAHHRIVHAIKAANSADPLAQHVYDHGPEVGWQIAAADVAISDISAMIYDRLATGKPLIVTRPADPAADVDEGGYLGACEWLAASEAGDVRAHITRVLEDPDTTARIAKWSKHYFGDTSPGAPTARFHAAIEQLMAAWDEWNERRTA